MEPKNKHPSKRIVNRFSELLGKRRLSISDVHRLTGISRTTLTNLYYAKSEAISLSVLEKLCVGLNCSVTDIFSMEKLSD